MTPPEAWKQSVEKGPGKQDYRTYIYKMSMCTPVFSKNEASILQPYKLGRK